MSKLRTSGDASVALVPVAGLVLAALGGAIVSKLPATRLSKGATFSPIAKEPGRPRHLGAAGYNRDTQYGSIIGQNESAAIQNPPGYPAPGTRPWEVDNGSTDLIPYSFMGEEMDVDPATGVLTYSLPGGRICSTGVASGNVAFNSPEPANAASGGVSGWFCNSSVHWWLNVVPSDGSGGLPVGTNAVVITASDWTPYYFKCVSSGHGNGLNCADQQFRTWNLTTPDGSTWTLQAKNGVQYVFSHPNNNSSLPIVLTKITRVGWTARPNNLPPLQIDFHNDGSIADVQNYLGQQTTYGYSVTYCSTNAECEDLPPQNGKSFVCNAASNTCLQDCGSISDCPLPQQGMLQGYQCEASSDTSGATSSQCVCTSPATCGSHLTSLTSPAASTGGTGFTTTFDYAPNDTLWHITLPPDANNQRQRITIDATGEYKLPTVMQWGADQWRFNMTFVGTLIGVEFPDRNALQMYYQQAGKDTVSYAYPWQNANAQGLLTYSLCNATTGAPTVCNSMPGGPVPSITPLSALLPANQKALVASKDRLAARSSSYGRDPMHHVVSYTPPTAPATSAPYKAIYGSGDGYYVSSAIDPQGQTTSFVWYPDAAGSGIYSYNLQTVTPAPGMGKPVTYGLPRGASMSGEQPDLDWTFGMPTSVSDGTANLTWNYVTGAMYNSQTANFALMSVGGHLKAQDIFNSQVTFQLEHDDINGQATWTPDNFDNPASSAFANAKGAVENNQKVNYTFDQLSNITNLATVDHIANFNRVNEQLVGETVAPSGGGSNIAELIDSYVPAASQTSRGQLTKQALKTTAPPIAAQLQVAATQEFDLAETEVTCMPDGTKENVVTTDGQEDEVGLKYAGWTGCGTAVTASEDGGADGGLPTLPEADIPDTAVPDTSLPDASLPDGGTVDTGPPPSDDSGANADDGGDGGCPPNPAMYCPNYSKGIYVAWCELLNKDATNEFYGPTSKIPNATLVAAANAGCGGWVVVPSCSESTDYPYGDPWNWTDSKGGPLCDAEDSADLFDPCCPQ